MSWSKIKKIANISAQRPLTTYRKILKEQYPVKEDMENPEPVFYREDQKIRKTGGFF